MIRGVGAAALLLTVLLAQVAGSADSPIDGTNVYSMTIFQGALYFVGTADEHTSILGKVGPAQPGSSSASLGGSDAVDRIDGQPIQLIRRISAEGDTLTLTGESIRYVFSRGGWVATANPEAALFEYNPGSGGRVGVPFISFWVPLYMVQGHLVSVPVAGGPPRRFLVWNSQISANSGSAPFPSPGIYEITGDAYQFYQLPQPTYDLFQQHRPERVKDGYTRDAVTLETEIGPFQLEGRGIHFGLRFYDGEGYTGVGGIGYFDPETRRYLLTYLRELSDWSASAIYVEPNAIWLGLVMVREGSNLAGGLLRYDRRSGKIVRYFIPALVNVIRRLGNSLYLGTSEGIYVVVDSRVEHLRFEIDPGGGYRIRH